MRVGILGGGISGITLQRFLKLPCEILEADPVPGGLCRTYWKNGFGYDIGGHILFSKNQAINHLVDRLLGENINHCRRANYVLFKGRYVKYPFENDLATLDVMDRYECLIGYLKAAYPKPTNFAEWMYYAFGAGIAEQYLIPYNRKIWKTDPRQMGVEWVERIPRPPMEDVVKSALGIPTEGYTHQLHFRYPLHGGAEALIKAMISEGAKVTCNAPVQSVVRAGRGWKVTAGGETRSFDHVVVAFPIHEAIQCFTDVPEKVRQAVASLRHNAIRIALVAVNNESLMDKSAIYSPDDGFLPHRVCYMGFFSPHMVRCGASSLIAEVTSRPGDEIDRTSDDVVLERIINDLNLMGVLHTADVVATDLRRIEYAYPVYDLEYTRSRAILHEYFTSLGVDLLGRFAEFDYINSDECIRRSLALADKLNRSAGLTNTEALA